MNLKFWMVSFPNDAWGYFPTRDAAERWAKAIQREAEAEDGILNKRYEIEEVEQPLDDLLDEFNSVSNGYSRPAAKYWFS